MLFVTVFPCQIIGSLSGPRTRKTVRISIELQKNYEDFNWRESTICLCEHVSPENAGRGRLSVSDRWLVIRSYQKATRTSIAGKDTVCLCVNADSVYWVYTCVWVSCGTSLSRMLAVAFLPCRIIGSLSGPTRKIMGMSIGGSLQSVSVSASLRRMLAVAVLPCRIIGSLSGPTKKIMGISIGGSLQSVSVSTSSR